jgi:hypothetical protein
MSGVLALALALGFVPAATAQTAVGEAGGGLAFIANGGQWPDVVRSSVRAGPLTAWFEDDGWIVSTWEPYASVDGEPSDDGRAVAVRLRFLGADPDAALLGEDALGGVHNDLRGNDSSRWISGLPMHGAQRWVEPYDGIDVVTFGDGGHLRYDLHVRPGADLADVAVAAEGALSLSVDDDGALLMETELGVIRQPAPVTWNVQPDGSRWPVDAGFRLLGDGVFGFEAPDADPDAPLVVDPTLQWATFLGGGNIDYVFDSATCPEGRLVTAGFTASSDYPTTLGSYDQSLSGSRDVFVTALEPDGASLAFSTLIGGFGNDEGRAVDVAADGTILVGGLTASTNFPTVNANHGGSFHGAGGIVASDGFVALLDADGQSLLMSAYVGGSHDEYVTSVAFGPDGPVFVGLTQSTDLAVTNGAFDASYGGGTGGGDGFVGRLDPSGATIDYLSYVGGAADDVFNAVMVEADGRITVAGWSASTDYPTSAGALQPVNAGFADAVVSTFDAGGSLIYSTFYGGVSDENARWVARSGHGQLVFGGTTRSSDLPLSAGAPDSSLNASIFGGDGFVAQLDPSGANLQFGTYFGGSEDDAVNRVLPLEGGMLAVLGQSSSTDFAVTPDAMDSTLGGNLDTVLALYDPVAGELVYASYVGGSAADRAWDLQVDGGGVVLAGYTTSVDLPVTPGAWDEVFDGTSTWITDGWVMRIDLGLAAAQAGTFTDLGFAVSGSDGLPTLVNEGSLAPLAGGLIHLDAALSGATGLFVMSGDAGYYPTHGGVLVPYPVVATVPFRTSGIGTVTFSYENEGNLPSGLAIYGQAWVVDPAGPKGWSATNAIEGIVP